MNSNRCLHNNSPRWCAVHIAGINGQVANILKITIQWMCFSAVVQPFWEKKKNKSHLQKLFTLFLPGYELGLRQGCCFSLEMDSSKLLVWLSQCDYLSCQTKCLAVQSHAGWERCPLCCQWIPDKEGRQSCSHHLWNISAVLKEKNCIKVSNYSFTHRFSIYPHHPVWRVKSSGAVLR